MTPATVPDPPEIVLLMDHLDSSPARATEIKKETAHNPLLSRVLQFVLHGWPDSTDTDELKPYWSRRLELSAQGGCLTWEIELWYPLHYVQGYCYNYMTLTWGYHA